MTNKQAMAQALFANVASVALTIEALEILLVSKGILADNELMTALEKLAQEKSEQVKAACDSSRVVGAV
jgi:predicted dinucleotide-utilizing enzyme